MPDPTLSPGARPALPIPRDPRVDPRRLAAMPSVGRITSIGLVAVLLPGVLVFAACRAAGLGTGGAGLWGLLAMFLGMGWYPTYLRRLGKRLDAQLTAEDAAGSAGTSAGRSAAGLPGGAGGAGDGTAARTVEDTPDRPAGGISGGGLA